MIVGTLSEWAEIETQFLHSDHGVAKECDAGRPPFRNVRLQRREIRWRICHDGENSLGVIALNEVDESAGLRACKVPIAVDDESTAFLCDNLAAYNVRRIRVALLLPHQHLIWSAHNGPVDGRIPKEHS